MKIGTIIIIVSVVWSIISGILAKKQAAAKKLAAANALSTGNGDAVKVWKADPVQIRVESLRRRNRTAAPSAALSPVEPVEPRVPKKAPQGKKLKASLLCTLRTALSEWPRIRQGTNEKQQKKLLRFFQICLTCVMPYC